MIDLNGSKALIFLVSGFVFAIANSAFAHHGIFVGDNHSTDSSDTTHTHNAPAQPVIAVDPTVESVDGTGLRSSTGNALESVDGTGVPVAASHSVVLPPSTDSVDGTGLQTAPAANIDSVDGTGVRVAASHSIVLPPSTDSVDGTGLQAAPAADMDSVDGTGLRITPASGTESVDGTGLHATPTPGTDSVDGTGAPQVSGPLDQQTIRSVDGTGRLRDASPTISPQSAVPASNNGE